MRKKFAFVAAVGMAVSCLVGGCGMENGVRMEPEKTLSYDDAMTEMNALMSKVETKKVEKPVLDIYSDDDQTASALADISVFPLTVEGNGDINIEIAGATEMTDEDAPDDWLNVVAKKFNKQKLTVGGKTISVSVRKITSGEVLTYMEADAYQPDVYIPSASMWGDMMVSEGIGAEKLTDRIAGNTAGILMDENTYDSFVQKYNELTIENVLTAAVDGDLLFAYTNPYTSTTGLNGTAAILSAFDATDPLSDKAAGELLEYQKSAPPVAYTTAVLRRQAEKGIINTMLMEEQAYVNTPELKKYKYEPFGIRHDHPVYTFDYCTEEEKEAAKKFVDFCLTEENQELATEKGFNRHEDYVSKDPGLDGTGWLNAQKVWKENKDGGKPVIAVFVADVSGSMNGLPLNSLKESLVSAASYISEDNYVGLVSFSDNAVINLPIARFDATQKAYFSGEVKNLTANGSTATYDAVLTALSMMTEKSKEVPNAKLMMFVLSDGEQNVGFSLGRVLPVVGGLQVPVYSIAYNYDGDNELEQLSGINEAAVIKADSDDVVNQLRNLFNVEI